VSGAVYLGIDIGTTSAKCLAVDEQGAVLALAQHPYPMSHPHEGWAEQDPEDYWNAVAATVGRCVTEVASRGGDPAGVRSIAMSTQGDALIVTDSAGTPRIPALSWMDTRAQDECRELLADADQGFWLKRHRPDVVRGARFCWVPDFIAKRLCGEFVLDAPSASWSPVFSPRRREWSRPVLELLDLDISDLPRAEESGAVIGRIAPDFARRLGLSEDVVLVAGAFDQAAAAHGAGARANERSVLSCGTAWVLYSVTGSPVYDESRRLPICCHVSSNEWGLVLPFTGGAAYDWLNRTLSNEASKPTGGDPPIFIPHLYGGVCPDWRDDSRGSLVGLTMSHTPEDIRLAMMRGIAAEARRNVEAAERIGARVGSVRMVGGATRSAEWPQIVANVLNHPVEVADISEAACFGAAKLAAGPASEGWPEAQSVRELAPDPEQVEFEDRQYRRYLQFHEPLLEVYGSSY